MLASWVNFQGTLPTLNVFDSEGTLKQETYILKTISTADCITQFCVTDSSKGKVYIVCDTRTSIEMR